MSDEHDHSLIDYEHAHQRLLHDNTLGRIDHDRFHGRIHLVKPDDLYDGAIEFDWSIDLTAVNVFWRGGIYKLVSRDNLVQLTATADNIRAAFSTDRDGSGDD